MRASDSDDASETEDTMTGLELLEKATRLAGLEARIAGAEFMCKLLKKEGTSQQVFEDAASAIEIALAFLLLGTEKKDEFLSMLCLNALDGAWASALLLDRARQYGADYVLNGIQLMKKQEKETLQ